MNKRKVTILGSIFVLLILILGTLVYINNRNGRSELVTHRCIYSFQRFAYHGPRNRAVAVEILPLPPWQVETEIPVHFTEIYHQLQVEVTRSEDDHQEIWLYNEPAYGPGFIVYHAESGKWEEISPYVDNTNLFVQELFVTTEGSLWGKVMWETATNKPVVQNAPVLVKFNEDTRSFESPQKVLEIPVSTNQQVFNFPQIILDRQDIFWIFVDNDGLYTYNSVNSQVEKKIDLPDDFVVTSVVLAADGSLYLEREHEWPNRQLTDNTLFQFIPETSGLVQIDVPDKEWPIFSGMVVDHTGRLWLGAIGYRDPSGNWYLMQENFEEYFEHINAGDHFWAAPGIMLESSTGILWYQKDFDSGPWAEGTAWYDPESGKGCLFTNIPANIIEDSKQQLWLVAGGKLFKYSQKP